MQDVTFGDVIYGLRKERGLTQQQLANKLKITDKAVSKWERGLSLPDVSLIKKIANVLDVDSSYLLSYCDTDTDDTVTYVEERTVTSNKVDAQESFNNACLVLGMVMGAMVVILNFANVITPGNATSLLGVGLFSLCLAIILKTK